MSWLKRAVTASSCCRSLTPSPGYWTYSKARIERRSAAWTTEHSSLFVGDLPAEAIGALRVGRMAVFVARRREMRTSGVEPAGRVVEKLAAAGLGDDARSNAAIGTDHGGNDDNALQSLTERACGIILGR